MNNLTLISKATVNSVTTLYECMHYFSIISQQKINTTKSKAFVSPNCSTSIIALVKNTFNIHPSNNFGKYLGFSILNQKPKYSNFQFTLDNMRKKLAS